MSLTISCPHCLAKLRAKKAPAPGRSIPCPQCGRSFVAQAAPVAQPARESFPVATPSIAPPSAAAASSFGVKMVIGGFAAAVVVAGIVTTVLLVGGNGGGKSLDNKGNPITKNGLDQRAWENRLAELNAELRKAVGTGNEILIQEKHKKVEEFFRSTLQPGKELNGWIGVVSSVTSDEHSFKSASGKPVSALIGRMDLRELNESAANVSIRFTNFDPDRNSAAALKEEFSGLVVGTTVRVWGRLHERPAKTDFVPFSYLRLGDRAAEATVTATRLEPVDLKMERAEAIASIDRAAATLAKLVPAYDTLLKDSFHGTSYNVHAVEHQSLLLAYHFPEYRAAVKDYMRFDRLPAGQLESWTKAVSETKARLENVRLLDEAKEKALAAGLEADLSKTLAPMEKQLKSVATISAHHGKYGEMRLPALRGEIKSGKQLSDYPPDAQAELKVNVNAYVPLNPDEREIWLKAGRFYPWQGE